MTPQPNISPDFPTDDQLASYFLGELRGPELASVAAWAQDPAHAEHVGLLQQAWETTGPRPVPGNLAATLAAVREYATRESVSPDVRAASPRASRNSVGRRTPWTRHLAFGVGLGLAALVGVLVMPRIWSSSAAEQTQRYVTAAGEQVTITLPDRSTATLAPQTELVVREGFATRTRTVVLRGEAVFQVQDQAALPFIVETGVVQTRVLGTTFAVRAYPGQGPVQVLVERGKVATQYRDRSTVLTAGMIAFVTDSGATVANAADLKSHIGWNGTQLAFRDVPVTAVLSTLGRWYGYEFRLADSALTEERVSTVLSMSKRDETLRALSQLLDVTFSLHGTVVTLTPRRSADSTLRKAPPRRGTGTFFAPTEVGK